MADDLLPDFETLKEIAKDSPEKIEQILRDNVNALVENSSEQQKRRLMGLQFQIDAQRRLAKNPVDACVRISHMMHDSFLELNAALQALTAKTKIKESKKVVIYIAHFNENK